MKALRQLVGRHLPIELKTSLKRARNALIVLPSYSYDLGRFMRASTAGRQASDREQLAAHLTMDYHRLEKGLALPAPRRGFGKDVVERLLGNLPEYERRFGRDTLCEVVRNVLSAYLQFSGIESAEYARISRLLSDSELNPNVGGGTIDLCPRELFSFKSAEQFLLSRRSIRQFTGQPVPAELISRAVELAQQAPSVCNRQSARVYVSNDAQVIARVLAHQNGNRGFGETVGAVFVVAADNRAFTSIGERNQMWVDGGIFAMSLSLSLHASKVGTCMLNWSVEPRVDRRLRQEFGIDENFSIITMLAAGLVPEELTVAASPRRSVDEVLYWIDRNQYGPSAMAEVAAEQLAS